jgi:hypothetical protein
MQGAVSVYNEVGNRRGIERGRAVCSSQCGLALGGGLRN